MVLGSLPSFCAAAQTVACGPGQGGGDGLGDPWPEFAAGWDRSSAHLRAETPQSQTKSN